ncbi:MAG: DUF1636 domain-containing protein [Paracoccaceae bacterium]|nr:DUF1636 domain-containing protein [Paracoccaceae bacterium]
MKISLCASCGPAQTDLAAALRRALKGVGLAVDVAMTDCMSGCTRPATLAFRSPGKTAYLFGDISAGDLPDLIIFARLYAASPDGTLADARPLGPLRLKAIARIPG